MNRGWVKPHEPVEEGQSSPWAIAEPLLRFAKISAVAFLVIAGLLLMRTYRSGDVDLPARETTRAEARDDALIDVPKRLGSVDHEVDLLKREAIRIDDEIHHVRRDIESSIKKR